MPLTNISALPHPFGNRIDLEWLIVDPEEYPSVRVMRQVGTHPISPDDGALIAEEDAFYFSMDLAFKKDLNNRAVSEAMRSAFYDNQISLSTVAFIVIEKIDGKWRLMDEGQIYIIIENDIENRLDVHGISSIEDQDQLRGETVYYYTLFPFRGEPPEYILDPHNRISAMATSPYNTAGQMYKLLPSIYHRYDTSFPLPPFPVSMPEEDKEKGQLRRFMEIVGAHLDQLHGFATATLDLYNIDRVEGNILPLLARWIGWKTDHSLELSKQRNEIKNAPAIYRTIGIIPTVEETVRRISGWDTRTKEFVHNLFLSNNPEKLNLWHILRSPDGNWMEQPESPFSIDYAFEGKVSAVKENDHTITIFYHTEQKIYESSDQGRVRGKTSERYWDIRYKSFNRFFLENVEEDDLDNGIVSKPMRERFEENGLILSQDIKDINIKKIDPWWEVDELKIGRSFLIAKIGDDLYAYYWTAGLPLNSRHKMDRHPTTTLQNDRLWIFWDVYDEASKRWSINYRTKEGGEWSKIKETNMSVERRTPCVVVDGDENLWLFWQERSGNQWQLRYKIHSSADTYIDPDLESSEIFPTDGMDAPRVESDLFVLFDPTNSASQRIWVFWSRKEPVSGPGKTLWSIAYRFKVIGSPLPDWSAIQTLQKDISDSNYHDREPFVVIMNNKIELFWSSNRAGSWAIWHDIPDLTTGSLLDPTLVTNSPYSQRDPLLIEIDKISMLIYGSNRSVSYESKTYGTIRTVDFRYSGSTTIHTRDAEKISLRGKFEDFQTYTYDAGRDGERNDKDWYARDTVGLYLKPDTIDPEKIESGKSRIKNLLDEFIPITDRAVCIAEPDLQVEYIYTYGLPLSPGSRLISETYEDTFIPLVEEVVSVPEEEFIDEIS